MRVSSVDVSTTTSVDGTRASPVSSGLKPLTFCRYSETKYTYPIGKSRLLAAAAALACERGFMVLNATGVQSEAHLPFAGLHQLLRPLRFRAADLPAAQRAVLDAAFGLGREPAPERFRIAMAVLDLLGEVATNAPLLVLAEGAQWLDRPTTEVLAFVARRLQSDPVVLLAAVREGYPSLLVDAGLPQPASDRLLGHILLPGEVAAYWGMQYQPAAIPGAGR